MRKVYICPEIEVTQTKLNEELLAGHSYDWVDAKSQSEELFDEDEEKLKSRNLWDE
jgi:hypothetical protein